MITVNSALAPPLLDLQNLKQAIPSSPAFVLDHDTIHHNLAVLAHIRHQSGCKILYSIKALPFTSVLETAKHVVDGFAVSSLFEAKLADEILAGTGSIHMTTPGLRADEWAELSGLVSHMSFNSTSQYQHFSQMAPSSMSTGLRINPKLSFLSDDRFNPCRSHSKLGADIDGFNHLDSLDKLQGLHFHSVFSANNFEPLLKTVAQLQSQVNLAQFQWLNLGGGYLVNQIDCQALINLVSQLRSDFGLDIFIEPGKAMVNDAGILITTVLDVFESDGKTVAILDTSVNHNPEVFEFQRQPALYEHDPDGQYEVILAGCTCLAGDVFGNYRFKQAPSIGTQLCFINVGAYTLIKANRFNGYNLPDIYSHSAGQVTLKKHYPYQAYRQQWLADTP